jgi:hypothetical protein
MADPQLVSLTWSIHPETNEVQSIVVSGRIPHVDGDITEYVKKHKHLDVSKLTATKRNQIQTVATNVLAWLKTKRAEERTNAS